jgi:hypothetical protein
LSPVLLAGLALWTNWTVAALVSAGTLVFHYGIRGMLRASLVALEALKARHATWDRLRRVIASDAAVDVEVVESHRVLPVCGDDVTLWAYDVGGNRIYWSSAPGSRSDWPNSSFEVVQVPGFEDALPPRCHGETLAPFATVDFREVEAEKIPLRGVTSGSLDDLVTRTRPAAGRGLERG